MFRSAVPRLAGQARQASSRLRGGLRIQPARAFGDRWLPVRRRNSWIDDFIGRPWGMRLTFSPLDHPLMRRMDRLWEEVEGDMARTFQGRGWLWRGRQPFDRYYGYTDVAVIREDGNFKVRVDVSDYKSEELSLRTLGERLIVKVEKKDADKIIATRQFTIEIPEEVDAETFESSMTDEGILTITAKLKEVPTPEERIIDIKHTGKENK